jgi:hypothetical protein
MATTIGFVRFSPPVLFRLTDANGVVIAMLPCRKEARTAALLGAWERDEAAHGLHECCDLRRIDGRLH